MKKEQMQTLAIADLDIEELERRLELAAPATAASCWDLCGADCQEVCAVNVKV